MKQSVTKTEVADFKNKWCDENQIITSIIRKDLLEQFIEPILDVGAGLGDIAFNSLHQKKVICIDVNEVTDQDYPLSDYHERLQVDFFDYVPDEKIKTLFIAHTLQFLDDDLNLLNEKIRELDPERIILVLNKNDDILGDLIDWVEQNYVNSNPEVKIPDFPDGYNLTRTIDFKANLKCENFNELATQISYLMLIDLDEEIKLDLVRFLNTMLDEPYFEFNQVIEIYSKNE